MSATMSSGTSCPASTMRRMRAASLVWLWMCQRKMSPTEMCTRSKSAASSLACVPLPQPWTPMMTYLCMVVSSVAGLGPAAARPVGPDFLIDRRGGVV
jgi:hypothetical protein